MRPSGVIIAGVALVVLAGCGAPTPTPTTSDSPVATVSTVPESVLPIACSDLADIASQTDFFGVPLVVDRDETRVVGVDDALTRQAGAVACSWIDDPLNIHSQTPGFSVVVLPDAEEAYRESMLPVVDAQYTTFDTAGDLSQFGCGLAACTFELVVDGHWASGSLRGRWEISDGELSSHMQTVLDQLTDRIHAAAQQPREAWVPPAESVSGWHFCDEGDDVVTGFADALGMGEVSTAGGGFDALTGEVWNRTGVGRCQLGNASVWATISFAPGGAWALDHFAATLLNPGFGPYETIDVPGLGPGRAACGPNFEGACSVFVATGGGLLNVVVSAYSEPGLTKEEVFAALPGLADVVVEAGSP